MKFQLLLTALLVAFTAVGDEPRNTAAPSTEANVPGIGRYVRGGEGSRQGRERIEALIAEGERAKKEAFQMLDASEPLDRAAGISVLVSLDARESVPRIAAALSDDRAENVRMQAAEALGALGASEGVPALVAASEDDTSRDVRVRAIVSLGRIESAEAVSAIGRHVKQPRSEYELQAAAIAAGWRRIVALESELIRISADRAQSDHVRSSAMAALGLIGSRTGLGAMAALIGDPSPVVRVSAIGGLEGLGDTESVREIERVLKDPSEKRYVRIRAATSLARMQLTEAMNTLREIALGSDEYMAMHSIVALNGVRSPEAQILAVELRDRAADPFVAQIADRVARDQPIPWGSR